VFFSRKLWKRTGPVILRRRFRELTSDENFSASGYQLKSEEKVLLKQAIDRGKKTVSRNIKADVQKIHFELATSYGMDLESLGSFIENSDFKLVVIQPVTAGRERAPPMGLGVNLGKAGRDVFASFQVHPKHDGEGLRSRSMSEPGFMSLPVRKSVLRSSRMSLPGVSRGEFSGYPEISADIDLELKIDQEIKNAEAWEARILKGNVRISGSRRCGRAERRPCSLKSFCATCGDSER